MTDNQAILTKAIQKAIDGGWLPPSPYKTHKSFRIDVDIICDGCPCKGVWISDLYQAGTKTVFECCSIQELIFNHDFAKALWGEQIVQSGLKDGDAHLFSTFAWKTHLVKMVISEDPIKYLGEHLPD